MERKRPKPEVDNHPWIGCSQMVGRVTFAMPLGHHHSAILCFFLLFVPPHCLFRKANCQKQKAMMFVIMYFLSSARSLSFPRALLQVDHPPRIGVPVARKTVICG